MLHHPGLALPAAEDGHSPQTRVVETHISTVFLCGNRAYKLLKPVSMGFLDYSSEDARVEAVEVELELNRRISPRVYLGTADVVEHGRVVDRFLVMERLPDDRRLPVILTQPGYEAHLREIARVVARFHAGERPAEIAARVASRDGVWKNWADNFESMAPFVGSILEPRAFDRVRRLVRRYLEHRDKVFADRIESGMVRDGHGDLTADDIFCLDDGPQILDCLAFSEDLRISDVLADVAFLAMDLDRLAGPSAAKCFMDFYVEFSNEHHPASLAHHYVAYRAHVRSKVALLRFAQGDHSAAFEARVYHELCLRHLEYSAVRLVLVGGGPGVGKSTLANAMGDNQGWVVLNSDERRKDITGHGHEERTHSEFGQGIYSAETTERVYCELLDQAALLMSRGESVVIDATWPDAEMRARAREVAGQCGATITEIECVIENETAKRRIATRNRTGADGASEATPATFDRSMTGRDPWPDAHRVSNEGTAEQALAHALRFVVRPPS